MIQKHKSARQQLPHIINILKNSLEDAQQCSKPVFELEEANIDKFSKSFQQKLMATKQVILELNFKKIFVQLRKKIEGLTKLFFKKDQTPKSIKFKNRRLQKFFALAKMKIPQIQLKISKEKIKQILQNESKLNMSPELFILKCFLTQNLQNQKYSYKQDPLQLTQNDCLDKVKIKFKIIHTYRPGQAEKIISSSIPSLQYYKSSYLTLVNSDEIKDFNNQINQVKEDDEELHKKCCAYLRYSMNIDFFNSVVKQQDVRKYLQMFSIIQNRAICQGLIVGALWSIPKVQDPEFSDSEQEQQWEDKKQNIMEYLCTLFQGYFESQDDNKQLNQLITRLSLHQQHNRKDLFVYLNKYWLKE